MNKENRTVTVVIPCFQQGHLLPRALDSIQRQTYKDLEVLVIDDGSNPPVEITHCYSVPVKLIRQENRGLSAARNTGLRLASGTYIKFLDADDELLPDCISDQVYMLGAKNTVSCIGFREINEDSDNLTDVIPAFGAPLSALLMVNIGPPHIYLYWAEDLRRYKGFSQEERVQGGHEDYDLILRMVVDGVNLVTHHSVGVIYYRREGTMSTVRDRMDKTRAAVWSYNVAQYFLKEKVISANMMLSLLTSFAHLLKITPPKYHENLYQLIGIFEERLSSVNFSSTSYNDRNLLSIFGNLEGTEAIAKRLSSVLNASDIISVPWHAQEIIDYRLNLKFYENTFPDRYLVQLLQCAIAHKNNFAVYGAGEAGQRILKILLSAGLKPVVIYDRGWGGILELNGCPVRDPGELAGSGINFIIIASFAYYQEIAYFIKREAPEVGFI
ncbi:glycosyltransferase family 2 protein [Alishewanella jeotgali]|uniref:Family 2 glycosyl transferase n=1 Tax=Alishewanella jeotgali KCTC 22429 TaxID=1129374 RepID=H3ZBJ8_9ALTE|nr:glycosyltransferase family 2 protein [Alishewanella jeotgali]EHR42312.1 family 2 glycosyl transferase [Alishewanella jeotgali KCTC 22429]